MQTVFQTCLKADLFQNGCSFKILKCLYIVLTGFVKLQYHCVLKGPFFSVFSFASSCVFVLINAFMVL